MNCKFLAVEIKMGVEASHFRARAAEAFPLAKCFHVITCEAMFDPKSEGFEETI